MNTSSPLRRCPACSAEIPAEAPQGLCPKCLLLGVVSAVDPIGNAASGAGAAHKIGAKASGRSQYAEVDKRMIPPSIDALASAFPQLEIIGLIGRGGMGFVYKARQPKLDRFVALKILPGHLANEPSFRERFEREARVLAKLQHPLIVSVYDFGEATAVAPTESSHVSPLPQSQNDGSTDSPAPISQRANDNPILNPSIDAHKPPAAAMFYLVLEFVDGVNLREAMGAGRFTPEQALAIVPQVCEALQYAHSKGVLHRDIKPENILLDTEGRVKIADFGIAKVLGPDVEASSDEFFAAGASESEIAVTRLTATGSVLGTPLYMAPEQLIRPNSVDHRADIFSLGVVFYEMLTGELPMGRFAPPSEKSLVDQRIDEVVMRALAKERELRQQSAGQMKTEVDTIVSNPSHAKKRATVPVSKRSANQDSSSSQVTYVERESPWSRRLFWLIASVVAMLVMVPLLIIVAIVVPILNRSHSIQVQLPVPSITQETSGAITTAEPGPPVAASAASFEVKQLGLINVAEQSERSADQNQIHLESVDGDALVEPFFSKLVRLKSSSAAQQYHKKQSFGGPFVANYLTSKFPFDYMSCDWSSGNDNPIMRGYVLPPGAYDFRPDADKNNWAGLLEAKDRAEIASVALKFIAEAAKSECSPSEWQQAAQSTHLRFRFVPKSISNLNVPEECLVALTDDSRTIFSRDGSRFTKYELMSADLIRGLRDLIVNGTDTGVKRLLLRAKNSILQKDWKVFSDCITDDCRDEWSMEVIAGLLTLLTNTTGHGETMSNGISARFGANTELRSLIVGLEKWMSKPSQLIEDQLQELTRNYLKLTKSEQRQLRIDSARATIADCVSCSAWILAHVQQFDETEFTSVHKGPLTDSNSTPLVIDLSQVSEMQMKRIWRGAFGQRILVRERPSRFDESIQVADECGRSIHSSGKVRLSICFPN